MRSKYIDVLKATAIIVVVLYHSGFLTYGYLGVDLFLVINGYFITKGLNRSLITEDVNRRGGTFNLRLAALQDCCQFSWWQEFSVWH